MPQHWTEEELTAALLGELAAERLQHEQACAECRAALAASRDGLTAWKLEAFRRSDRPAGFWSWMQSAILQRHDARSFQRRFMLVSASALALLLVAAALTTPVQPVRNMVPAQKQQVDADDVLLYRMQVALAAESPEALAPARVLTHELDNRLKPVDTKTLRGAQP